METTADLIGFDFSGLVLREGVFDEMVLQGAVFRTQIEDALSRTE